MRNICNRKRSNYRWSRDYLVHPVACYRMKFQKNRYFFRLSAYQDKLLEFYEQHPDFITPKERLMK